MLGIVEVLKEGQQIIRKQTNLERHLTCSQQFFST